MIGKKELVELLAERTGMTKKDSNFVIDSFLDVVREEVVAGEVVKLPELCIFDTVDVAERTARNPKTGEAVVVPAKKRIRTKISEKVKEAIN